MKRLVMLMIFALATLLYLACPATEPVKEPVDVVAETAAIEAVFQEFDAAVQAADPDRVANLHTEDGIQMPPETDSSVGRAAIREAHAKRSLNPSEELQSLLKRKEEIEYAKPLLKLLLAGLIGAGAVPTALFLFGEGLVGLHHVWRAHHLVDHAEDTGAADRIVREFEAKIETLSPERAHELVQKFSRHFEPDDSPEEATSAGAAGADAAGGEADAREASG